MIMTSGFVNGFDNGADVFIVYLSEFHVSLTSLIWWNVSLNKMC